VNINPEDVLKNEKWLDIIEINTLLDGISHIIMAAPTVFEGKSERIHFALFLNTQDDLPAEIARNILEKFAFEHQITEIREFQSSPVPTGFAQTHQETPMPIPLEDSTEAVGVTMYLISFTGKSPLFAQAHEGLTGWSYVRN
jgi:hypothetical protein